MIFLLLLLLLLVTSLTFRCSTSLRDCPAHTHTHTPTPSGGIHSPTLVSKVPQLIYHTNNQEGLYVKHFLRTCLNSLFCNMGQYEVCRTCFGRGMGTNITAHTPPIAPTLRASFAEPESGRNGFRPWAL